MRNDDYDYIDDDDEYFEPDDDEDYIDYDEDDDYKSSRSSGSSLRGSVRPFGSGSSRSSDRDDIRSRLTSATSDDDRGSSGYGSSSRLPGSSSFSRSKSSDSGSSSSGSSRYGSSSRLPGSSSFSRSKGSEDSRSSSSSGSSYGSSSRLPGSSSFSRSKSSDDRKSSSSSGSSYGGSSAFGSSRLGSSGSSSSDKKDDKKDSGSSSGRSFGGFGSRLGGGSSSSDKKDDKKESSSSGGGLGGFRSRLGGGGSSSDKKDDKKDSGSSGGGLGGFRSRLGGGGSSSDKKDDKKDSGSSGGGFGGFGSRLGGGGSSSDKKDDKKDSGSSGGGFGGFGSRLGGGGSSSDKKDDKKDSGSSSGRSFGGFGSSRSSTSNSSTQTSNAATSTRPGGVFGSRGSSSTQKKDDPKQSPLGLSRARQAMPASAQVTEKSAGGGLGTRIGGFFGRGNNQKSASSSRSSSRTRAPKVPQAKTEDGLTLDNWLDILGVGLVFFSLVLFFSAISQEQAAIAAIHVFLGQLFGWGALAVPITMFAIGMWLIVRHFGDDAPTVDPIRVVGVALGFVTLLVLFQYIQSFQYQIPNDITTMELLQQWLEQRVQYSWEYEQAGGGLVGAEIYLFLYSTITEIGGFVLMLFLMLLSAMLITRLTAAEILRSGAGVWLSMREGVKQQAEKRRIERQLAAQQAAEIYAQQAQAVPESTAPAPETAAQTAAAESSFEGREIRISSGGQFSTLNSATAQASNGQSYAPPPLPRAPRTQDNNNRRGFVGVAAAMGGLLSRGGNSNSAPPPPMMPAAPLPMDDGYTHFDGENGVQQPAQPAAASEPPLPRVGDMLNPAEVAAAAEPSAASAEAAPAAAPKAEEVDPVKARQERLDALRRGEAGPLSQSNLAEARREGVVAQAGPSKSEPEQVVRDRVRAALAEEDAFIPPSKLPSVQPDGSTEPRQQRLSAAPPVSSRVQNQSRPRINWRTPEYRTLLSEGGETDFDREELLRQANIIEDTLQAFGAPGRVVEVNTGPVITQFGVEPDYITGRGGKKQRVKVSAIAALDKDMQLALGARSIRVEAPVPGKGYVGIEVPNKDSALVSLRDVLDSASFQKIKSPLAIALGQSVSGAPVSADLSSMPHLLIAGTTGSGKSVCVNSIIASILVRNTPDKVKFIMVDPKRVELTGYNGIPHLVAPVVVDLERIVGVLKWVTREMDDRYKKFSERGSRNIVDYNNHIDPNTEEIMPFLVVIIDELADLMMLAPEETERTITRIAALARATGIHLVIATQRPSVDVVTGLIKANFPARIAFAVAGSVDSRVILDQPGAERLLGKGDMLYLSGNSPAPLRMQGVFLSDMEINNITRYWKMQAMQQPSAPMPEPLPLATSLQPEDTPKEVMPRGDRVHQQAFWDAGSDFDDGDLDSDVELTEGELTGDHEGNEDELYEKSVELVRRLDKASISLLQRRLRIGYTRAARLIDMMEARGVIGPAKEGSSKPRDVLKSTL